MFRQAKTKFNDISQSTSSLCEMFLTRLLLFLNLFHICYGVVQWDIIIKTCALEGSGTDARTYLKVFYEEHHTQETIFLNDQEHDVFERGQRDQFTVGLKQNDVINVGLYYMPSATLGEPWCVDWVIMTNRDLDKCYVALFDKWIHHYSDPPTYPKMFHATNYGRCTGAYGV